MRQYLISLVSVLIFVFTFAGDAKAVWLIEFVSKDCLVKTIEHYIENEEDYEKIEYYEYDDHNKRQRVEVKDSEGKLIEVRIFHYDNERLLSIEELDNHEKPTGIRYLEYAVGSGDLERLYHWKDEKLIQIEELYYEKNGDLEYKVFWNVENDEIVDIDKVEYYDFDEGTLIKIETLDNYNGNLIKDEEFHYNPDGTIQKIEYVDYSGTGQALYGQELYEWECIDIDTGSGGGSGGGGSGSSGSSTSGCFIGTTF